MWTYKDLFVEKHLIDAPVPLGKPSIYTKGIVEALSGAAQSSVYNAIEFVKSIGSPKKEVLSTDGLCSNFIISSQRF